jgi:capsular exopolysaccharide synthesis family protein
LIFRKTKKRSRQSDRERLLISFPPNSRYAEAYRTLRTNLFFSDMDNEVKSILVTSAVEKEGKTTTAINLGIAIAQTDRKVLVMDCDLRRPYLTTLIADKFEQPGGVTELITEVFGAHLTKGSLNDYAIADLIQLARLQKRSARLDLENEDTRAAIVFEKGVMTDIFWKNRPESKRLANTLVREKLVTEKQALLALSHQKKSAHHLGNILHTMGLVSREDLSRSLSVHTIEAIRAVCAMETGHFVFSPPARDRAGSAGPQNVDIEKLFAEFNTGADTLKYFNAAIENAIHPTEVENLSVMPSGKTPPNPAEVAGSSRMAFLIEHLKSRFDFIIIDTPPVTPATDALLIAPLVDGTVLVVKSGNTDRKIIQDVIDQFRAVKQPVIGMILNQVDMRKEGYYKYYQKYYSSYYGSK